MSEISAVPTEILDHAVERTLKVIGAPTVLEDVADYYRIDSDYAGALFLEIPDPDPTAITVADLFAVSTLSIKIPERAARRLLMEAGGADTVNNTLRALPEKSLVDTDDEDLRLMEKFYRALKDSLRRAGKTKPSGAWVTASKIAARKRPGLFPVRDTQVTELLGTRKQADYFTDWIVYRHLMKDGDVVSGLQRIEDSLQELADGGSHLVESARLRLLDVALWTFTYKRS